MAMLVSIPMLGTNSLHTPTASAAISTLRASRSFALELGKPTSWSKSRVWCVSAGAANPQNEVQSAEQLREQLEALQHEAEQVRGRASSARLRFMRLSHVVEQLRQRAAMDVRMGNEDSARLLLTEKQKVMRALEASRQRAELLEQLAAKLNVVEQAISMKETVLIEALSNAPLSRPDDDTSGVHHVSPRTERFSEESGVDEDQDQIFM